MSSAVRWLVSGVFAVVFVLGWWDYFRLDVRFRIRRDPTSATSGSFPATDRWATDRRPSEVLLVAQGAIVSVGGKQVRQVDNRRVYGWVGSRHINIASLAEYQLLVTVEADPEGRTVVVCSVRPGYRRLIGSRSNSQEWLQKLSRELRPTTAAPGESTPI